jgi:hypoxanthine phosphoribosyltransferase
MYKVTPKINGIIDSYTLGYYFAEKYSIDHEPSKQLYDYIWKVKKNKITQIGDSYISSLAIDNCVKKFSNIDIVVRSLGSSEVIASTSNNTSLDILGKKIAAKLNAKYTPRLLHANRKNATRQKMHHSGSYENRSKLIDEDKLSFSIGSKKKYKNLNLPRILIIDDVTTSGSTAAGIAKAINETFKNSCQIYFFALSQNISASKNYSKKEFVEKGKRRNVELFKKIKNYENNQGNNKIKDLQSDPPISQSKSSNSNVNALDKIASYVDEKGKKRNKVKRLGIPKEAGYLYYLSKDGDVWRKPFHYKLAYSGKREKVVDAGVTRESGFLYFIDMDGDVSRAYMRSQHAIDTLGEFEFLDPERKKADKIIDLAPTPSIRLSEKTKLKKEQERKRLEVLLDRTAKIDKKRRVINQQSSIDNFKKQKVIKPKKAERAKSSSDNFFDRVVVLLILLCLIIMIAVNDTLEIEYEENLDNKEITLSNNNKNNRDIDDFSTFEKKLYKSPITTHSQKKSPARKNTNNTCDPDNDSYPSDEPAVLKTIRSNFQPERIVIYNKNKSKDQRWSIYLEASRFQDGKFKFHKNSEKIIIKCFIDKNGEVVSMKTLYNESGEYVKNEAAKNLIKKLKFSPGLKDGRSICMWISVPVIISKRK